MLTTEVLYGMISVLCILLFQYSGYWILNSRFWMYVRVLIMPQLKIRSRLEEVFSFLMRVCVGEFGREHMRRKRRYAMMNIKFQQNEENRMMIINVQNSTNRIKKTATVPASQKNVNMQYGAAQLVCNGKIEALNPNATLFVEHISKHDALGTKHNNKYRTV